MNRVNIIAAIGRNRGLGRRNELLWWIPDDLRRFKSLTMGHPVIMGRKTFESIGKPLPGRTNIVVTRGGSIAGATTAGTMLEALAQAEALDSEVFVIGGAQVYEQTIEHFADRLYLTLVDDEPDADAFFPPYEHLFAKILSEETREWSGLKYQWVTLER